MLTDLKTKRSSRKLSTTVCTHWQCWFCVSSALVVRSAILRFFSHGVLFVKFLCAPVFVCLKGPWAYVCAVSFDVIRCTLCSETVLRPSSWLPSQTSHRQKQTSPISTSPCYTVCHPYGGVISAVHAQYNPLLFHGGVLLALPAPTKTIRFLTLRRLHAMTCMPKSVPYYMRLDILKNDTVFKRSVWNRNCCLFNGLLQQHHFGPREGVQADRTSDHVLVLVTSEIDLTTWKYEQLCDHDAVRIFSRLSKLDTTSLNYKRVWPHTANSLWSQPVSTAKQISPLSIRQVRYQPHRPWPSRMLPKMFSFNMPLIMRPFRLCLRAGGLQTLCAFLCGMWRVFFMTFLLFILSQSILEKHHGEYKSTRSGSWTLCTVRWFMRSVWWSSWCTFTVRSVWAHSGQEIMSSSWAWCVFRIISSRGRTPLVLFASSPWCRCWFSCPFCGAWEKPTIFSTRLATRLLTCCSRTQASQWSKCFLYYALLIDLTVLFTKVSAYVLVGIRMISEVGFIECVHFLRSRIPWLRCFQCSHVASTTQWRSQTNLLFDRC